MSSNTTYFPHKFLNIFIPLLKLSRPQLWLGFAFSYCIGLSFGKYGIYSSAFNWHWLIITQILLLTFPCCLLTFGINDVYDKEYDLENERKKEKYNLLATIEGRYTTCNEGLIKVLAMAIAVLMLIVSSITHNLMNIFYTFVLLVFAITYSTPPWRLKNRAPLDSLSAGIAGFMAPFGMGFSLVDTGYELPLQCYLFTLCAMGLHSFTTIMDYQADSKVGCKTMAVVFGKRVAAIFPAVAFGLTFFFIRHLHFKIFVACLVLLFAFTAIFPEEKYARTINIVLFYSFIAMILVWLYPCIWSQG